VPEVSSESRGPRLQGRDRRYRQHATSVSRLLCLMSESVLYALQSQKDYVSGNRKYLGAWKKGMRNWRRRYHAAVLVARMRESARAGHWGLVMCDTVSLLACKPADADRERRQKDQRGTIGITTGWGEVGARYA